jgi:hypothetical protein
MLQVQLRNNSKKENSMKKVMMALVFCVCLAIASYAIAQCSMDLGSGDKMAEKGEAIVAGTTQTADETVADGTEVVDEAAVVAENAVQDTAPVAEEVVDAAVPVRVS